MAMRERLRFRLAANGVSNHRFPKLTLYIALRDIGARAQRVSAMTPGSMKCAVGIATGYIVRSLARAGPIECESPIISLSPCCPVRQCPCRIRYRYAIAIPMHMRNACRILP